MSAQTISIAGSQATAVGDRPRARPQCIRRLGGQSTQRPDKEAAAIGRLYRRGQEATADGIKFYLQVGGLLIQKRPR